MVVDRDMVWLGWQESANCETPEAQERAAKMFTNRDGSPAALLDLYYPSPEDMDSNKRLKFVRHICNTCKVKKECLEYALTTRESHGVWGGLTTPERERLREMTLLDEKVGPAKEQLKEIAQ